MAEMPQPGPNAVFTRRHDLDWLRIAAFAILIFYHVGMFFVTWGWHVKSPDANEGPELLMRLVNPWRLALLFFISGVALRFLADKIGSAAMARDRFVRIAPVIVFGMVVLVMPQTWFELRQAGAIGPDFLAFYGDYLRPNVLHGLITPTWNHLWYVVYLLVYSLLLAPFIPGLRALGESGLGRFVGGLWSSRFGPVLLLVLPVLPFIAYRLWLDPVFPTTHALIDDWANHAHRLTILLIGFWAAKSPAFWGGVRRALSLALVYAVFYGLVYAWAVARPGADWEGQEALLWAVRLGRIVYAWAVILTLLGLAQRFLSRDGSARRYLTEAIFPFYILHQTITVAAGYYIAQAGWGVWTQFLVLVSVTLAGCMIGFELIRRVAWLRPVFGLKVGGRQLAYKRNKIPQRQ
ncbi:acyltransferase family protein [Hyphobacterium sp. Y6023]|uniref:Acyltransferase family protein n=2 Tax=Hyphobacterium marinum TaxID=3116574 RepID=A0ABU7LV81_9PROT|nr:acyltransferase family protein [Hyphobacterium sp. Y6023]